MTIGTTTEYRRAAWDRDGCRVVLRGPMGRGIHLDNGLRVLGYHEVLNAFRHRRGIHFFYTQRRGVNQ